MNPICILRSPQLSSISSITLRPVPYRTSRIALSRFPLMLASGAARISSISCTVRQSNSFLSARGVLIPSVGSDFTCPFLRRKAQAALRDASFLFVVDLDLPSFPSFRIYSITSVSVASSIPIFLFERYFSKAFISWVYAKSVFSDTFFSFSRQLRNAFVFIDYSPFPNTPLP